MESFLSTDCKLESPKLFSLSSIALEWCPLVALSATCIGHRHATHSMYHILSVCVLTVCVELSDHAGPFEPVDLQASSASSRLESSQSSFSPAYVLFAARVAYKRTKKLQSKQVRNRQRTAQSPCVRLQTALLKTLEVFLRGKALAVRNARWSSYWERVSFLTGLKNGGILFAILFAVLSSPYSWGTLRHTLRRHSLVIRFQYWWRTIFLPNTLSGSPIRNRVRTVRTLF